MWPHGRGVAETSSGGFPTDPTRIYRMPEDQVAKRGTTVQLECRVKHDPSLKLTVYWLKDDEPLYVGNRCLLLPPFFLLLLWGVFFSLALGDAVKNAGNLCHVCH